MSSRTEQAERHDDQLYERHGFEAPPSPKKPTLDEWRHAKAEQIKRYYSKLRAELVPLTEAKAFEKCVDVFGFQRAVCALHERNFRADQLWRYHAPKWGFDVEQIWGRVVADLAEIQKRKAMLEQMAGA